MRSRKEKLLRAAEILLPQDDRETELDKLVAASMQAGYELGKLAGQPKPAKNYRRSENEEEPGYCFPRKR